MIASRLLQETLEKIQKWLDKWRIKVNETKSLHITFITRRETCPPAKLNNQELPTAEKIKYLGLHLDKGFPNFLGKGSHTSNETYGRAV